MEQNWTIENILSWTEKYFIRNSVPEARVEAEVLLSFIVGCPRLNLHVRKDEVLSKEHLKSFKKLIIQRGKRVPASYILGEQDFFGMKILVNEHTLIPRPETEILVEEALKLLKESRGKLAADICSGSGCIAVALAKFSSLDKVYATDLSQEALRVLFQNAVKQNVLSKIVLKRGDLLEALSGEKLEGNLDLIISNPPYVAGGEYASLEPEIKFEPVMALMGGEDGLDFYRRLAAQAGKFLKKTGYVVLEMNSNKSPEIQDIFKKNGFIVEKIVKDYSGLDRIIIGKLNG